jgi:glycosyltransferase involved in cell wall biosynthesis
VLAVGALVALKGVDLVIRAMAALRNVTLIIAGAGPDQGALQRLARDLGVGGRVRFLGPMTQQRLAACYSAADVLVLASAREGFPNVLLEALACGTPVVATAVGGVPEIVRERVAGRLVQERSPEAIAEGIQSVLAEPPARAAVRAYAERFAWGPTTAGQIRLFRSIVDRPG